MKVKDAPATFKAVKKEKKSNQPTLYMTKIQICNFSFGYSLTTTAKKIIHVFCRRQNIRETFDSDRNRVRGRGAGGK